jgi:hypothetical protein
MALGTPIQTFLIIDYYSTIRSIGHKKGRTTNLSSANSTDH